MPWRSIIIRELKLLNFHIYSQWLAFMAGLSTLPSLVMMSIIVHEGKEGTLVSVVMVAAFSFIILIFGVGWPLLNMLGSRTSTTQNETLIFAFMYFGIAIILFFTAVEVCMPALVPAVFLTLATATAFTAVLRCQPMIHSRVLGGNGVEHMVLVVRNPDSWNLKGKWPLRWFMKDEGRIALQ